MNEHVGGFTDETPHGPRPVGRQSIRHPTVRDVFTWPGFAVTLVAGAEHLDRPIRVAQATELVDPTNYLRRDALIMTVGHELVDDATCARFVENLIASGASAIALAVGVEGHTPPPGLAPAAERAGIALFEVPPTLPFVSFSEKLFQLAEHRSERERRRREDGRMLDYVRRGYASAQIFQNRFPEVPGAQYAVLCVPVETSALVEGVIIEGWIDDVTVVVADEIFVRGFEQAASDAVYGLGSPVPQRELARSIKEAMATFTLSTRRGAGVGPRDLSTFGGLVERLTSEQLAPFRAQLADPLQRYDARRGRSLWPTLRAFIQTGASVSATADLLDVHENSVRNRLSRVHELTGLDPMTLDGQFALAVAVHAT
ncbi:PucR family transcriptional regulator [Microbacterium karelineae]|uniref:PucR family transcriptional regulator n=1 Tax=Microbacterium karelineae TaxID=2654283 RepID=UPI0018D2B9ED|nr:PucR family transcriptional regulator [Microbacterium karelineae]